MGDVESSRSSSIKLPMAWKHFSRNLAVSEHPCNGIDGKNVIEQSNGIKERNGIKARNGIEARNGLEAKNGIEARNGRKRRPKGNNRILKAAGD